MGKLINIVVTSTKRKRQPVPSTLQFRSLAKIPFEKCVDEWCSRLEIDNSEVVAADELYAGDHWQISRFFPDQGRRAGWAVQLWICSPGYGLIRQRAPIHPYSANFSIGHPDGITASGTRQRFRYLQDWWARLKEWPGPEPGQPRTVEQLASRFPGSPLLLVASETIVRVLEPDLRRAADSMQRKDQFLLVSGGTSRTDDLGPHLLPCDARLQTVFGGARMSLNVRTVRFLLESGPTEEFVVEWSRRLAELLKDAIRARRVDRVAMTDEEIVGHILNQLCREPAASWSRLLRELRESGHRCEQKRFAAIFKKVVGDQE